MGDRRVSHTTLAGVALSSDLDALVPFWHSSLLDAQTDAERYALPVVSAPKNARQALKIDMVSAYALSRRLRVSTIGELFALLDKKVGHALLCGEEGWFVWRASTPHFLPLTNACFGVSLTALVLWRSAHRRRNHSKTVGLRYGSLRLRSAQRYRFTTKLLGSCRCFSRRATSAAQRQPNKPWQQRNGGANASHL